MYEIIIYGRGGQGAKIGGEIIAKSALLEGKFIQAFPEYGPERRGAPTTAFVRISDKEIRIHEPIKKPDCVIVLDDSVLEQIQYKNCVGIVNTKNKKKIFKKTWCIDANKLSYDIFGRVIPNTVMMGGFVKATSKIKLDSLLSVIKNIFGRKYNKEITDKNIELVKRGFNEITEINSQQNN
ncbi:MAG: hypothetical protein B6U88_00470 [Candidatus Aenigmarchaeota archaeon ex4484_56]|nr:MAG: hypothetical protein B6U88_00470 [Candidatus Aenigmarchaeota archaeon ex4484_56]